MITSKCRACYLVWQRIAGRVGLSGLLSKSVSRPMSAGADVDTACGERHIVWHFFGCGYASTVREVRKYCLVSARNVDAMKGWILVLEGCVSVCVCVSGLYGLCIYVCMSFMCGARVLKKKQHVPLTCDTCHKHDIRNNSAPYQRCQLSFGVRVEPFFGGAVWGARWLYTEWNRLFMDAICDIGAVI